MYYEPSIPQVYLTLSSGSGSLSLSSAFLFTPLLSELLLGPADDWVKETKQEIHRSEVISFINVLSVQQ